MAKRTMTKTEQELWLTRHALLYITTYQHLSILEYLDVCHSNLLPEMLKLYSVEELVHELNSTVINLR